MARPSLQWGRLLAAFFALASTPCVIAAQSSSDEQREAPEVRKLTIRGVKHVAGYEVQRSIATDASGCRSLLLAPFCLFSKAPVFFKRRYLDETELKRDVLRLRVLYFKHGYRETEVDTIVKKVAPRAVEVTFNVREGAPTRVAALRLDFDSTIISRRRVQRLALLRTGRPLDLYLLDSARVLLEAELWNRGFADAVVDTATAVNSETHDAAVVIRLTPNRRSIVGPIVVQGEDQVSENTILNSITLRTGALFRRNDALESQRNLYESNLFRLARIVVPQVPDSVKPVNIEVIEGKLRSARYGGGFSTVDFFQIEGRFTHFNALGGARRLDVTGTLSNLLAQQLNGVGIFQNVLASTGTDDNAFLQPNWSASVDFRQPAFLQKPENAVGVGLFAHRRSIPGIFIDHGYGGNLVFTRTIRPRAPASATYQYEITRVEASEVYFCTAYGVCDLPTITALRAHQSLSPLSISAFIDRSDQPFTPSKGYVARLDLEHASAVTLSDYRYNRAYFDAAAYTHFNQNPRNVLAGRIRLGAVRALAGSNSLFGIEVLHPRKRFYAGGSQSVRGYGESQLGPRILTVTPGDLARTVDANGAPCDTLTLQIRTCDPNTGGLGDGNFDPRPLGGTSLIEGSVEYRFATPIHRKVDGAVFIDAALVGSSQLKTLQDLPSITQGVGAITPGFGVRYNSPVGPIRIDIGINPGLSEDLPVVTQVTIDGKSQLIALQKNRQFNTASGAWLKHFVFHLSIGQAF